MVMVRKEEVGLAVESESWGWVGDAPQGDVEGRELGVVGRLGEGVSSLKDEREAEGVRGGVWTVKGLVQGLGRRVCRWGRRCSGFCCCC